MTQEQAVALAQKLAGSMANAARPSNGFTAFIERAAEISEARALAGVGPWHPQEPDLQPIAKAMESLRDVFALRESGPVSSIGAYGDIELALQNVEWRREVQTSWFEFSRWGIQNIIYLARLYWVKNPIARRLINIVSAYVFGRGVEVSSPDEAANAAIQEFFADNQNALGQIALSKREREKWTDGNLYWAFFPNKSTGRVKLRRIDATEIEEIRTNPEDVSEPWFYKRKWTIKPLDGSQMQTEQVWYPSTAHPAIDGDGDKPADLSGVRVDWEVPVYHRRSGEVGNWLFGCPEAYPALDWAKEARKYLEAIASVKQALNQFTWNITSKGGQQAIHGIQGQLQSGISQNGPIFDPNPPAVAGSTWISGPGTQLAPIFSRGAAGDPEEVRRYLLLCCIVFGVPETFLADVSTGNLATATTLDRPTELAMLQRQEEWREDLVAITTFALSRSLSGAKGRLREAFNGDVEGVSIVHMARRRKRDGTYVYEADANAKKNRKIEIKCTFPTIREGDQKELMEALVQSATLGNRGGEYIGIDEKAFVIRAYEILGIENGAELAEQMYPDEKYIVDRSEKPITAPIPKLPINPGGVPQFQPGQPQPNIGENPEVKEALRKLVEAAQGMLNGHA